MREPSATLPALDAVRKTATIGTIDEYLCLFYVDTREDFNYYFEPEHYPSCAVN